MMNIRYWQPLPSTRVVSALSALRWEAVGDLGPSSGTAALMVYVALSFFTRPIGDGVNEIHLAEATYDQLVEATRLSRRLISDGLHRLQQISLIEFTGSHQQRKYVMRWGPTWFKVPCQAIVMRGVIVPFTHFTMRSKTELNAMKIYLYLAAARSNQNRYSIASYEKIFERTGVPERDIRKGISVLINTGLLRNVSRAEDADYGPNRYFFTGSENLIGYSREAALPDEPSRQPPASGPIPPSSVLTATPMSITPNHAFLQGPGTLAPNSAVPPLAR